VCTTADVVNHASWCIPLWVYTTAGGVDHASWCIPLWVYTTAGGVDHFWCAPQPAIRSETGSLKESPTLSKEILQLCDRVRDVDLWNLGVYLEDRDGDQPALIRLVAKELRESRVEREERENQKQTAKEQRAREAAIKADKGRQNHQEMFRTEEYSAWDAEGLPTKDKEGKEITKSKAKKLRKEWEKQKERHDAWAKANIEAPQLRCSG